MKFTLEINCDNDAFQDLRDEELMSILQHVQDVIKSGVWSGELRSVWDSNGNRVGNFTLAE